MRFVRYKRILLINSKFTVNDPKRYALAKVVLKQFTRKERAEEEEEEEEFFFRTNVGGKPHQVTPIIKPSNNSPKLIVAKTKTRAKGVWTDEGEFFPTTVYHDDYHGVDSLYRQLDLVKKPYELYYRKQSPYTPFLNQYNQFFEEKTADDLARQIAKDRKRNLLKQTRIAKKITSFEEERGGNR